MELQKHSLYLLKSPFPPSYFGIKRNLLPLKVGFISPVILIGYSIEYYKNISDICSGNIMYESVLDYATEE